jgi:hypothetical protein
MTDAIFGCEESLVESPTKRVLTLFRKKNDFAELQAALPTELC